MKFGEGKLKQALGSVFGLNLRAIDGSTPALAVCLEDHPMTDGICHITSDDIFISQEEVYIFEEFLKADRPRSKFMEKLREDPDRWMLVSDAVMKNKERLFLCRVFDNADEACDSVDPLFENAMMLSRPVEEGLLVCISIDSIPKTRYGK